MAKDNTGTFPGAIRDHKEAVQAEAAKVNTKIEGAFRKLATKMSERAKKAKAKMDSARKPDKRGILLRRFELYSDAATHLKDRLNSSED